MSRGDRDDHDQRRLDEYMGKDPSRRCSSESTNPQDQPLSIPFSEIPVHDGVVVNPEKDTKKTFLLLARGAEAEALLVEALDLPGECDSDHDELVSKWFSKVEVFLGMKRG